MQELTFRFKTSVPNLMSFIYHYFFCILYLVLTDRILGEKELIDSTDFEYVAILVFTNTLLLLFLNKKYGINVEWSVVQCKHELNLKNPTTRWSLARFIFIFHKLYNH